MLQTIYINNGTSLQTFLVHIELKYFFYFKAIIIVCSKLTDTEL